MVNEIEPAVEALRFPEYVIELFIFRNDMDEGARRKESFRSSV